MRDVRKSTMAMLAAVAIGSSGMLAAQRADIPMPTGRIMTFDIAGVRLGMSPAEARAALERAGYRVEATESYNRAPSFEQRVRSEADRRLGRPIAIPPDGGVANMSAYGPHRETIRIEMMQRPLGSAVSQISFQTPQKSITRDAFRQQVLTKYGNADWIVLGDEGTWCSSEAVASCGRLLPVGGRYDTDYPRLTAGLTGRGLTLSIGSDAIKRLDAAREVAVEKLAPKTSHAAF